MSKRKRLLEQEYKEIKYATQNLLSNKRVASIFGRSTSLVNIVKRTESFDEYQKKVRDVIARSRANVAKRNQAQEPIVGTSAQPKTERQVVSQVMSQDLFQAQLLAELRAMNERLERLANAWEWRSGTLPKKTF